MWSKFSAVLVVISLMASCAETPGPAQGPHPSIWPCATVHEELQRQETANKQARQTQDSITWIPVVGLAGFAIKPDHSRATQLQNRAYECKQRAGI